MRVFFVHSYFIIVFLSCNSCTIRCYSIITKLLYIMPCLTFVILLSLIVLIWIVIEVITNYVINHCCVFIVISSILVLPFSGYLVFFVTFLKSMLLIYCLYVIEFSHVFSNNFLIVYVIHYIYYLFAWNRFTI